MWAGHRLGWRRWKDLRHVIELDFWDNVVDEFGCRTCWIKRMFVLWARVID